LQPYVNDQESQRQSIAQVCGPSLCTQNSIMNAIAAHKDELKKLLENVSGDTAVLGITNCSNISSSANPPAAQINGELTWNQH